MDQLKQAFERAGVTREALAETAVKECLGFLVAQVKSRSKVNVKNRITKYLMQRANEFHELPDRTPLYRVAVEFSKSSRSTEKFEAFLERVSKELRLAKSTILITRDEWGLKRR